MKNERTDKERIKKAISTWDDLKKMIKDKNISSDSILNDQYVQWTITTPIYNIGEQIYNVSKELKNDYPDLPWSEVSGLRHRLVHDYDDIKWSIIKNTIEIEMDPFIKELRKIVKELDK